MAGSWLRAWGRGRARRGQDRLGWVLRAASVDGVLRAASVGITLSPSARVVVLLKSDFHGFYC
jgi:hypothetical protein